MAQKNTFIPLRQTDKKVSAVTQIVTYVLHTEHVLFILSKISKDILRTCLRTFEADIPKIFKNVQHKSKNSAFL